MASYSSGLREEVFILSGSKFTLHGFKSRTRHLIRTCSLMVERPVVSRNVTVQFCSGSLNNK